MYSAPSPPTPSSLHASRCCCRCCAVLGAAAESRACFHLQPFVVGDGLAGSGLGDLWLQAGGLDLPRRRHGTGLEEEPAGPGMGARRAARGCREEEKPGPVEGATPAHLNLLRSRSPVLPSHRPPPLSSPRTPCQAAALGTFPSNTWRYQEGTGRRWRVTNNQVV